MQLRIEYLKINDLKPYERNTRKHEEHDIDQIAKSIEKYGFSDPIGVWGKQNIIVEGHGRLMAAKQLGMESVPVIHLDHLTDAERREYAIMHNRTAELSSWDFDLLEQELADLNLDEFDFEFETNFTEADWFSRSERDGAERQEGNEEYNEFLEKFEEKKTTDDCYTPDNIYNVVAEWVAKEYDLKRETFIRPFYPGGDYQREKYKGKIVVDNPPFSILSEIEEWYNVHDIKYFLFAPSMSCFPSKRKCCAIGVGVNITYENGAVVSTSFVTNLESYAARTAPALYKKVDETNKENTKGRELPVYAYPPQVVTAAMMSYLSKYGQDFRLAQKDASEKIGVLDAQRSEDKGIFGGGFLISEKAAAEKAAAEKAAAKRWELSEREWAIIRSLGK